MPLADASAVIFSVGQGVASFTSFLPRLTDVRKASKENDNFVADLRIAEIGGSVITLGIALIAASLAKSVAPMYAGLFIVCVIVVLYESVLRQEPFESTQRLRIVGGDD
jgi:hypothetical protein